MAYNVPEKTLDTARALCTFILKRCGGASAIANTIGETRQGVATWIGSGDIPHTKIYDVANALDVDPWLLSYHKLMQIFGEKSPTLQSIVAESFLKEDDKKWVLDQLR